MNTQLMSKVSICLAAVIAIGATTMTAQPSKAQMFEGIPAMNLTSRIPSPTHMNGALSNLYHLNASTAKSTPALQPVAGRQRVMAVAFQSNKLFTEAALKQKAGKTVEAIKLYGQVATLRQNIWGEHDPQLAKIYSTLVGLYRKQGDLNNAETCSRRALSIAVKNGISLNEQRKSLVDVLEAEKKFDEAYTTFRLVVECDKQSLGENSDVVTSEEVRLAQLAKSAGKTDEAAMSM